MTLGSTAPPDTSSTAPRTRPFTGAEYLESLRDGREIWIYGERVKDVTTHPAFRNTVRMIARLYDALHDHRKDTLRTATSIRSTTSSRAPWLHAPRGEARLHRRLAAQRRSTRPEPRISAESRLRSARCLRSATYFGA